MNETEALAKRLADGDAYLAANPDDKEAKKLYYRLLEQFTSLMIAEEDRLVVTLAYPDYVTFGDGSHEVKVCLEGARHNGEWDRDDLSLLTEALKGGSHV